jgi:hypothetical protein
MFWLINTSGMVTNVQERKKTKIRESTLLVKTEFRPEANIPILKVFSSVSATNKLK